MRQRLYRNKKEGVLFGVCAGVGDYFDIDPVFVRITWLLTFLLYGGGLIAYLIACLLIPNKSE